MGRASRCLHNLFTKSNTQINNNNNHTADNYKPKWITTLIKSCKDINRARAASVTSNSVVSVATCSKTIASRDNEQSAIVVDEKSDNKAVNASSKKAVVEVVRASRSGRVDFDRSRRAAVVIQSVFRGYLARKALRALRALVRLQALVRGYIVRKQAVDQVWRMQALIRAQALARAIRAPVPASSYSSSGTSHSYVLDPPTPEYTEYYSCRVWSCKGQDPSVKNQLLQRNSSKSDTKNLPDHQIRLGSGRTFSRRFDSEKINRTVEVDSSAKSYNLTKDNNLFVLSDYISHNAYRTSGIPHPVEDLYLQYSNEIDRYSFYTTGDIIPPAHTGSFRSSNARRGGYNVLPNVNYSESYLSDHPNYMAYTQSSKAKMRSLSAPRQRTQLDRSTSPKCYSSHDYGSRRLSASDLRL